MPDRDARIVYRPLEHWPDPPGDQVFTPFSAPWSNTVDLLLRETDHLGAPIVVVELDLAARDFRRDDQMRANARVHSEKVRITVESPARGTLSWHTDRYRLPRGGQDGWRENVRAIALTMDALRSVERYGAVHGSEQYRGFAAIEARAAGSFSSPEEALRWLRSAVDNPPGAAAGASARIMYRFAAQEMHPDRGGDPGDWSRLDEAKRLLENTDLW